jgi:hypothetical protein
MLKNRVLGIINNFYLIYKWNHILNRIFYRILNTLIYDFQKMIEKQWKVLELKTQLFWAS